MVGEPFNFFLPNLGLDNVEVMSPFEGGVILLYEIQLYKTDLDIFIIRATVHTL